MYKTLIGNISASVEGRAVKLKFACAWGFRIWRIERYECDRRLCHVTGSTRIREWSTSDWKVILLILCVCMYSYLGACQLELDVLYARTWLGSYITDPVLRPAVVSHEGLAYMDAVVLLLKQQPPVLTGSKSASSARQQKTRKTHNQRG